MISVKNVERMLGEHGPVDAITVDDGDVKEVHVRHLDDATVVVLYEVDGERQTVECELLKESYQGIRPKDSERREMHDDVADAVQAAGYTFTSQPHKGVINDV